MHRPLHRVLITVFAALPLACQHGSSPPPTQAAVESSPEPSVPQTIAFEPGFLGEPLRTTELSADVELAFFADGSGAKATQGTRISFLFSGYDAATGQRVMGTRDWPAKLVVGASPTAPIDVIMQEALDGVQSGARLRVHVPAQLANVGRSEREGEIGDLWLTLTVTDVEQPQPPHDLSAFEGTPASSTVRDRGLEIHDFAAGEGLEAVDGDRVEFHYVVTSTDGETLLSTHVDGVPVEMTLGANTGVPGLSRGLRGVTVGTLRKLVIPAELGFDDYAPQQFPRNVPLVMYLEVTRVDPGPDREL